LGLGVSPHLNNQIVTNVVKIIGSRLQQLYQQQHFPLPMSMPPPLPPQKTQFGVAADDDIADKSWVWLGIRS
jgi:hypothetical protein